MPWHSCIDSVPAVHASLVAFDHICMYPQWCRNPHIGNLHSLVAHRFRYTRWLRWLYRTHTSRTAQGGGRSFKDRKPIAEFWLLWRLADRANPLSERQVVDLSLSLSVSCSSLRKYWWLMMIIFPCLSLSACPSPQSVYLAVLISIHLISHLRYLNRWLRTRRCREPTFRSSRATRHWKKTQCFDVLHNFSILFYLFAHPHLLSSDYFWLFLLSDLLSFFLFSDSSHLCCFICRYCRTFELPLVISYLCSGNSTTTPPIASYAECVDCMLLNLHRLDTCVGVEGLQTFVLGTMTHLDQLIWFHLDEHGYDFVTRVHCCWWNFGFKSWTSSDYTVSVSS